MSIRMPLTWDDDTIDHVNRSISDIERKTEPFWKLMMEEKICIKDGKRNAAADEKPSEKMKEENRMDKQEWLSWWNKILDEIKQFEESKKTMKGCASSVGEKGVEGPPGEPRYVANDIVYDEASDEYVKSINDMDTAQEPLVDMPTRRITNTKETEDPWEKRSRIMNCKTCMWFDGDVGLGFCRRHAPRIESTPRFTHVHSDDWCGEYQLRDTNIKRR